MKTRKVTNTVGFEEAAIIVKEMDWHHKLEALFSKITKEKIHKGQKSPIKGSL